MILKTKMCLRNPIKTLILISFVLDLVISQDESSSKCILQDSCDKCLLADKTCAWCTDREYGMRNPRCLSQTEMMKSTCSPENVVYTVNTQPTFVDNNPLKDFNLDEINATQIQPQRIRVELNKVFPQTIRLKYKPAKNYPLDLYYLMDLTYTMADDKETLVNIGEKLATALNNLTENYRIGFGSFIEKPIFPYIIAGKEKNPCSSVHKTCFPTYDFWHQMSLSKNITQFIQEVSLAETSANLDNIEAGFDALMQILVCNKEIGWVENSRKIVVYATDGGIHFAGDGKLAGIVKRNDKKCHLDENGIYTAALDTDYPSAEEMYRELLKQKVNVIFAVTDYAEYFYDQLQGIMDEVVSVGILKSDSSNILDLVEHGYKTVFRRVQFSDDAPDYISVSYETTCGGLYPHGKKTNRCDNVEIGNVYEFVIELNLLDFPDNETEYHQIIKIEESSFSESLEIEVVIQKPCTCLQTTETEKKSVICNEHGEFKCGMCNCDDGWSGKTCKCNLQDHSSDRELENSCRKPNDAAYYFDSDTYVNPICSDHGECSCGECFCNQGFVGTYCECFKCLEINGEECGGNERATCNCGTCECKPGWGGEDCSCSTQTDFCFAPDLTSLDKLNESLICSGKGKCECGSCNCEQNYYGSFCESKFGSYNILCDFYKPCVQCMISLKQKQECYNLSELCVDRDGNRIIAEYFDEIDDSETSCIIRTTNDDGKICDHKFSYRIDHTLKSQIRVVVDPCIAINVGFLSIMIFIGTILLGILILICCRLKCYMSDKREYAKFEEDLKNQTERSYISPIYRSPITRYEMPVMNNEQEQFELR